MQHAFFAANFVEVGRQVRKVGYGEVEEVMSEFNIVNESMNDKGRYRAIELLGK